jgi:hypothetical protein
MEEWMKRMRTAAMAGLLLAVPVLLPAQYLPCWDYGAGDGQGAFALVEQHDEDKGYVLAGYGNGGYAEDLLIVATDSLGAPTWAWTNPPNPDPGHDEGDCAWSMVRTADGGYAIAGWTNSLGIYAKPPYPTSSDIFIIKLNQDGTQQWANTYTNALQEPFDEWAMSIIETSNRKLVVAGWNEKHGYWQPLVMEVTSDGAFIQAARILLPGARGPRGNSVTEVLGHPDIRYAVAGQFVADSVGDPRDGGFLVYLDAGLSPVPGRPAFIFPGPEDEKARSVAFDGEDVVVAGYTTSYGLGGGPPGANIFVAKFDTVLGSGPLWSFVYGLPDGFDDMLSSHSLVVDPSGGGYGLCWTTNAASPGPDPSSNYVIMKLDNAGNITWARAHPSDASEDQHEEARAIVRTLNGGFAVAGTRSSGGSDSEGMHLLVVDDNGDRPRCVMQVEPLRTDLPVDSVWPDVQPDDFVAEPFVLREVVVEGEEVCVYNLGRDVGPTKVDAPSGTYYLNDIVMPACSVYNFGSETVTYSVRMRIGTFYDQTALVTSHAPGDTAYVTFPNAQFTTAGSFAVSCSTELADDESAANDKLTNLVRVRTDSPPGPGWNEQTEMPVGASGRPVKRGGWLAYCTNNGLVYAAKGYKTNEFYSFDPATGQWTELCSIPEGTEGKLPEKGCKGVSDGSRYIYMTKGNNTLGFWRYDRLADAWEQLPEVPLGQNRKKVKGGTDLVYVPSLTDGDDYVYLMKGYKTEFYRYSVPGRSWHALPDMPSGPRGKWNKGSWLMFNPQPEPPGNPWIAAHMAKYHDGTNHYMYLFDVFTETWRPAVNGMPLEGLHRGRLKRKKSKDGGSAALGVFCPGGWGYALKGGNTQQFFSFFVPGGSDADSVVWTELDTVPFYGSTGKKKGVKHGGDIVYTGMEDGFDVFYVLKGNKTRELWRFAHTGPRMPNRDGLMESPTGASQAELSVATSPSARGVATISYTMPKPGPGTLLVLDAAGRCIAGRELVLTRQGRLVQDVSDLAAGVYLLRLDTGEGSASAKLVVQK